MPETPADLFERYGFNYRPESPLLCAPGDKQRIELENRRKVLNFLEEFHERFEGRSPHFISVLHELHVMTVTGIYPCGGTFRDVTADVQIEGSSHHPPPPSEIEARLNDMLSRARNWSPAWSGHQRVEMAASNFHEFLNVHPYRGGNGRVARAHLHLSLYEMEVIQPPLTLFEYMLYRRHQYMDALHAGDTGDLAPMRRFIQRGVMDANISALCDLLLDRAKTPTVDHVLNSLTTKERKFVSDARVRRRLSDREFERTVTKFTDRLLRLIARALEA